MEPAVRSYAPGDLDAVYDICVRTADAGGDARGHYSSDLLVGDLFAAPYVTLEPEHAYVLDDGAGRAVGYVLGTTDTARFVCRYRNEWIPRTAARHPLPADPPVTPDDVMLALHHHPERMLVPELAGHPAHLHIDLLPQWQGRGWGRRLMVRFLAGLHAAGVPSVHLGMQTSNVTARRFYDRLGFTEVPVADAGPLTYLARSTAVPDGAA
ncbi:GNAT family N-acetyltransferase [Micromonospora sp. NPDC000018]|uniref:GNAT family N-acetyltransferase n=1 Tax=Micromonospora sp. NPDC000018 TaxID=3154239 RepID=UPI003322F076